MKIRSLIGGVLTLLTLGSAVVALQQHQRLTALRLGRDTMPEATHLAPIHQKATTESSPTNSIASLTPAEHLELLQLRGRVRPLMDQIAEAQTGTNRVTRLRAQLADIRKWGEPPGPGYMRRSEARNLGNGTPEAVLETFMWALEHRDAGTLIGLMSEPERQSMERQLSDQGPDKFFSEVTGFPGGRILQRKVPDDHTVVLEVEYLPGVTYFIEFRQSTHGWVMVLD